MLFEVPITMTVDAIDKFQTEIIALGALQAAKAEVHNQAARVVDAAVNVTGRENN